MWEFRLTKYCCTRYTEYCKKLWLGLGVEVTYNFPRTNLSENLLDIWALI